MKPFFFLILFVANTAIAQNYGYVSQYGTPNPNLWLRNYNNGYGYHPYGNYNGYNYYNNQYGPGYYFSRSIPNSPYQNSKRRADERTALLNSQLAAAQAYQNLKAYRYQRQNALDRKELAFAQAERKHQLQIKENDLRAQGILPPKPPRGVTVNGNWFPSSKAYLESEQFKLDTELAKRAKNAH